MSGNGLLDLEMIKIMDEAFPPLHDGTWDLVPFSVRGDAAGLRRSARSPPKPVSARTLLGWRHLRIGPRARPLYVPATQELCLHALQRGTGLRSGWNR
jgi:hypothetical protein